MIWSNKSSSHIHSWKSTLTITPEDKERTKIYDGKPLAIQALPSVEEGTTAYYRSRIGTDKYTDWSTAVAEMVDAGELFIQAKAVNPNDHDALCEYTLKISHKPVTVKADDMEKMYVEQDPTLNATMEGLLNEDTLT